MAFELYFVIAVLFSQAFCHTDATRHSNVGIIGGHRVKIERAPYMASLRLNGTYHWCGASIIHEQFVLTAAHCIVPNREFKVLVGTDNINEGNGGSDGQLFKIEHIAMHEEYNNRTMDFDLCIIKLKEPLTFGPKVGRVFLAEPGMKLPKGTELNATGWGSTGIASISPKLLQVEVPVIAKKKCKVLYGMQKHIVTSRMICAGNPGHDACTGDSGGPLTLGDIQVGVTSFGLGCGVMPGIYTRVASVAHWIEDKIHMLQ